MAAFAGVFVEESSTNLACFCVGLRYSLILHPTHSNPTTRLPSPPGSPCVGRDGRGSKYVRACMRECERARVTLLARQAPALRTGGRVRLIRKGALTTLFLLFPPSLPPPPHPTLLALALVLFLPCSNHLRLTWLPSLPSALHPLPALTPPPQAPGPLPSLACPAVPQPRRSERAGYSDHGSESARARACPCSSRARSAL